ncbi:unnamed protein product [Diamesa hyperborea]
MSNTDYDEILNDIDALQEELTQIQNAPCKSSSNTVLMSEAEQIRDMFRLHLINKRNNSNNLLLDEETIDNLSSFNEEALKCLTSFKKISEISKVNDAEEHFKELDEVHKYVMKNKEILSAEMSKVQSVCQSMETLSES